MIKYMTMIPLRLFYPEPGDTGGGEANENGGETKNNAEDNGTPATTDNGEPAKETESSFFAEAGEGDGTPEENDNEENGGEEPELLTFDESLKLQENEVRIISELAKKHGVKGEVMVPLFTELSSRLNENMQADAKAEDAERRRALREAWGKDYKANVKGTVDFIRAVGKARGWSEDEMKAMDTPEAFKVMNDIRLFLGTNKSFGTQSESMTSPAPVTPKDARAKMRELVDLFMQKRYQYDQHAEGVTADDLNRISAEHQKMGQIVYGKDYPRILKSSK